MTYTNGPEYMSTDNICKKDIISICNALEEKLNKEHTEGTPPAITFSPEGITEGGIKYNFWNNEEKEMYKTVRLGLSSRTWPYILDQNTVKSDWENNNDIIVKKERTIQVYLKSFGEAPKFTLDELKIWTECFQENGFEMVGKYPNEKKLE